MKLINEADRPAAAPRAASGFAPVGWLTRTLRRRGRPPAPPARRRLLLTAVALSLLSAAATAAPLLHQEPLAGGRTFFWGHYPRSRLTVEAVRRPGPAAAVYRSLCPGAAVVMSGGFWGYDDAGAPMPLGLVVSDGRRDSPPARWGSGGALVVQEGRFELLPTAALRSLAGAGQALQSMPLLIRDGVARPQPAGGRSSQRLAVGLTAGGELVIAGVTGPWHSGLPLADFVERLLKLPEAGGPRLREALALDGGSSVYLYLPGSGEALGAGLSPYVPNALCLWPAEAR